MEIDARKPSFERGCKGKANLGRDYVKQVDKLSIKYNKSYGVYQCPHCAGYHVTTKLHNTKEYRSLLYISETKVNEREKQIK